MLAQYLSAIILRDLQTLRRELEAYPEERDLWATPPGIVNSAGTLGLHLAGNMRHFVGAVLGGSGYVRNRDAEFSRRDVPRTELLAEVDAAIREVERALRDLPADQLAAPFPVPAGKVTVNTTDFLIHLVAHFDYHLGQVDYHRRLVTGQNTTVGAQAIPALHSARPAT
jgi:uncharacterized damage-inducible protein DinB